MVATRRGVSAGRVFTDWPKMECTIPLSLTREGSGEIGFSLWRRGEELSTLLLSTTSERVWDHVADDGLYCWWDWMKEPPVKESCRSTGRAGRRGRVVSVIVRENTSQRTIDSYQFISIIYYILSCLEDLQLLSVCMFFHFSSSSLPHQRFVINDK